MYSICSNNGAFSVCVSTVSIFYNYCVLTFSHNKVKQPQKLTTEVLHLNELDRKTDLMRLRLLISSTIRISFLVILIFLITVAHKRADNYNFACISCSVNTQCVSLHDMSCACAESESVRHLSQLATCNCGSLDL